MYIAVGGLFAFDDLNLYSSAICELFKQFALRVEGESDRPSEFRLVVSGFMSQL